MQKEVTVSSITALASIVLFVLNVGTAGYNRHLVLQVEDTAKRGELVRVKALDAIDSILDPISQVLASVRNIHFIIKQKGKLSEKDIHDDLQKISENRIRINNIRMRNAHYLTKDIVSKIDKYNAQTESICLELRPLEQLDKQLQDLADEISEHAHSRFLKEPLAI